MLEQLLAELAGEYPAFREVFLDERDIYLTNSLQAAATLKIKLKQKSKTFIVCNQHIRTNTILIYRFFGNIIGTPKSSRCCRYRSRSWNY